MNWKSIIATAIVTGLVTIVTGMLLFWWQEKAPALTYNSIRSIPFDDPRSRVFIQQLRAINSGEKPAQNVVLMISFQDERILKSRVDIAGSIPNEAELGDSNIRVNIPSLNPRENAGVSVLLESVSGSDADPAVSLRADGVTGTPIGDEKSNFKLPLIIALIAAYMGIGAGVVSSKRGRQIARLLAQGVLRGRISGGHQKQIIGAALAREGYPEKAREYLSSAAERYSWAEADLLASEAIAADPATKAGIVRVLLSVLEEPSIAPSSRAVIYFHVARVLKANGADSEQVNEHLKKAKSFDEEEVVGRLERDAIFANYKE